MKLWALCSVVVWAALCTGCYRVVVSNTNTLPQGNPTPVDLTWSQNPTNGQPNPGRLPAGAAAEFLFLSPNVNLAGVDPEFTADNDTIDLTLTSGKTRFIEWNGFEFIDQGEQRSAQKNKPVTVTKPTAVRASAGSKQPAAK